MKPDRELYRGEHRGIQIDVSRHWGLDKETWCFYLWLAVEQFPEHLHPQIWLKPSVSEFGSIHYPYYDSFLKDLPWHSGMTWYSKEANEDSPFRSIKAGCDYAHLWDESHRYSAERLFTDARAVVEELYTVVPELKTMKELWDARHKHYNDLQGANKMVIAKPNEIIIEEFFQ